MRIITLKQPWASLVAAGIKKYEFRTWNTKYRGKLLIHAGSGVDKKELSKYKHLNLDYPKERIIAEVEIVDCLKLDEELNKKIIDENNIAYGNKYREGYAWKFDNIKPINSNKVVKGKLGIWNIEEGVSIWDV